MLKESTGIDAAAARKRRNPREPYTERGISRVPCKRCGAPSFHQWQCCADDNVYRGLCIKCDVALNEWLLRWFGKYMDDKPMVSNYPVTRQAGPLSRYCFFLRGLAGFFTSSDRGFTGCASIRRASSSSDIAGSSGASLCGRGLLMVVGRRG